MPITHGRAARLWLGGVDCSSWLRSTSLSEDADVADATALTASAKSYVAGTRGATVSFDGLYDGAPSAIDATLASALGAGSLLTYWPSGDTFGRIGRAGSIAESSYEISAPVADVATITGEAVVSGVADRVVVLAPSATVTASGTGSTLDNGAQTTTGGAGYLHVFAATGTLTVRVQHSADAITWVDLVTFTAASSPGAQRVVLAPTATVLRYLRATWTLASGSATFGVAFGRR